MLITVVTILILATILGMPALASARVTKEDLARQLRINKLIRENNELTAKGAELGKAAVDALDAEIIRRERAGEIALENMSARRRGQEEAAIFAAAEVEAAAQYAQEQEDNLKAMQDEIAALEDIRRVKRSLSTTQQESLDAINAQLAAVEAEAEAAREAADQKIKDETKVQGVLKGSNAVRGKTAETITRLTGLASSYEESMLGALSEQVNKAGGLNAALKVVGEQLLTQLSPANLFAGAIEKVFESTMAMVIAADSAFASFNRTTGAAGAFDDVILDVRTNTAGMGVGFDEAVAATQDLYLGMRQFSLMGEEAQTELAGFVAGMEHLGVASGTSAEFMNNATTAMGMNSDQAMTATRELAASAAALGMAPEEMMSGFNAALPQLAHWGDGAVDVFKGLAAAAKSTGIEMQALLGIVGQFDTFEGAAEAAGRLNAVLGDDLLNSMDLMNASEEERIRMMIESIEMSGRSWEAMGRFERRALANAAGITDMAQANQLFGQSLSAYDEQQAAAQAGAMSQEEMEERARQNTSAQESLARMMESLAIAVGPVVKAFNLVMDFLLMINTALKGWFIPTMFALIGVTYLFTSAKVAEHAAKMKDFLISMKNLVIKSLQIAAYTVLAAVVITLAVALGVLWLAWWALNKVGAKNLIIVGLVVGAFTFLKNVGYSTGTALGIVAAGFIAVWVASKLLTGVWGVLVGLLVMLVAYFFAPMHSPALYIGLFIIAAGVLALGLAANFAGTPMLIFGAAALMVGAGVALMGLGVMLAAKGLAEMFTALSSIAPAQLFLLAAALYFLVGALIAIGIAMMLPWTTVGLMALTVGFLAIGTAFKSMSLEKFDAFRRLTDQMKDLDENIGLNLTVVGAGISSMVVPLLFLPVKKAQAMGDMLGKMSEVSTTITPTAVESAKQMTEVIKDAAAIKISFASILMWDKAVDNLIKVIKGDAGGGAAAAGGGGAEGGTTVILELDGRQLGRTVVDLVNRRYNLRTST
jgi:hypothetical protein